MCVCNCSLAQASLQIELLICALQDIRHFVFRVKSPLGLSSRQTPPRGAFTPILISFNNTETPKRYINTPLSNLFVCVLPSNTPPTHTHAHAHTLRCAAATQSVWFPTQKGCELLPLFIPLSYFMSLSNSLRTICSSIAMLMTPPPRRRAPNTQPAVSLDNSNLFVAKSYEFLCICLCLWEKLDLERTGGGVWNVFDVYNKNRK